MTHAITLDQLRAQIQPLTDGYVGRNLKHIKSSSYYRITSFQFKEDDMSIWFTYETKHRIPVNFMRPLAELFDGRFEFL